MGAGPIAGTDIIIGSDRKPSRTEEHIRQLAFFILLDHWDFRKYAGSSFNK